MNDMVNHIENSDRIQTTQNWYGDYLQLIKTKQDAALYIIAGANRQGILSVLQILGI